MRQYFTIVLVLSGSLLGLAQSTYQTGLLPALTISRSFPKNWKGTFDIESRQQLRAGTFDAAPAQTYEYLLTDLSVVLARRVSIVSTLAGGYLLRVTGEGVAHRTLQQWSLAYRQPRMRLGHRFAADQTWAADEPVTIRLRYRITPEWPLSGEQVDKLEFYFKLNNEYLQRWQGGEYDLEIRLVPLLGYELPSGDIEAGLDYRLDSFVDGPPEHTVWFSVNWYWSL